MTSCAGTRRRAEFTHLFWTQDPVEVKDYQNPTVTLAHAHHEPWRHRGDQGRRGLDRGDGKLHHLGHEIDDHAHSLRVHLGHDDPRVLVPVGPGDLQALAQVQDRDDLAAHVDDPLDEAWSLGHSRDRTENEDLLHLLDGDGKLIAAELEDHELVEALVGCPRRGPG